MDASRLLSVMKNLTTDTVWGELVRPAMRALETARYPAQRFRVLSMADFLILGVLRHVQRWPALREQVQAVLHLAAEEVERPPLTRSTWSDALASPERRAVLEAAWPALRTHARTVLPDRLQAIPGLGHRPIYAADTTYQPESAHSPRRTPRKGGTDNAKGHALLSVYDLRVGCAADVWVETRSAHEITCLRDYDRHAKDALTRVKNGLWVVDRALIDARFWDAKKEKRKCTMITRWKDNLGVDHATAQSVAATPVNQGVVSDERIALRSSSAAWRRITIETDAAEEVCFLTNELDLEPGVVAFLYLRRWDTEKCFDTWKNDFAQARAWGVHRIAIENQARLALFTHLLVALWLHNHTAGWGIGDEKALAKQDRRRAEARSEDEAPPWTARTYRYPSKISRQVLRFLKHCFLKKPSHALYECQLKPMLLAYL
jgi:Transposase DDE domain